LVEDAKVVYCGASLDADNAQPKGRVKIRGPAKK